MFPSWTIASAACWLSSSGIGSGSGSPSDSGMSSPSSSLENCKSVMLKERIMALKYLSITDEDECKNYYNWSETNLLPRHLSSSAWTFLVSSLLPYLPRHPQNQNHQGATCHRYCQVNWPGSARKKAGDFTDEVPASVLVCHGEDAWTQWGPRRSTCFNKGWFLFSATQTHEKEWCPALEINSFGDVFHNTDLSNLSSLTMSSIQWITKYHICM